MKESKSLLSKDEYISDELHKKRTESVILPLREKGEYSSLSDMEVEELRLRLEVELLSVEAECKRRGLND